ncbi:MAG: hypothetical protein IPK62_16015 [Bacteroidetes bacterium]|nr:hypothetical protein [Bacteroidota bacterium]
MKTHLNPFIPLLLVLSTLFTASAFAQYTATPHLLKDINTLPANSNFAKPIEFNGKLLFSARDWRYGDELWVSDGTANGTSLLKDINPGFSSSDMSTPVKISTGIVFAASTATNGYELWISDGTSNGTKLIKDIAPGGKDAIGEVKMEVLNNKVFFKANPNDGTGEELWVTDGTENVTQMIKDINSGALCAGYLCRQRWRYTYNFCRKQQPLVLLCRFFYSRQRTLGYRRHLKQYPQNCRHLPWPKLTWRFGGKII